MGAVGDFPQGAPPQSIVTKAQGSPRSHTPGVVTTEAEITLIVTNKYGTKVAFN